MYAKILCSFMYVLLFVYLQLIFMCYWTYALSKKDTSDVDEELDPVLPPEYTEQDPESY